MEIFAYCLVFVLGTIVGSFLNVVLRRYHSGRTFLGRSFCFSCGKTLQWYDLFPVASFLALRGKCRFCRSKISSEYMIVEVITGLLFMLLFWKAGGIFALSASFSSGGVRYGIDLLSLFLLGSVLVVIGAYDIKHKIIPDAFVYTFAGLALLRLIFLPPLGPTLMDFLAGPILALPFAFLWYVSEGRWMGFGDSKLALGIGWLLGIWAGFAALVIAFWLGALFGLGVMALGKIVRSSFFTAFFRHQLTLKSEIPFAPFLIIGLGIAWFVPAATGIIVGLY